MNKVILLALLMPGMAFGQIMENFESGTINNWVQSPEGHWIADNTAVISGNFSLHHSFDNPDAGYDLTGLQMKNLHPAEGYTKWSFSIRHGYDPSSSNNWAVFLMSDTDPALLLQNKSWNGFAVGVNQTGYDDTLRLWKVKKGVFTAIAGSSINWQSDIGITDAVTISVERSPAGQWSISVFRPDESLAGTASGSDPELFTPDWFIVSYKYSSTRDRLLWLDDIAVEGVFYEESKAPEVTGIKVTGRNSLEISFNAEPRNDIMAPVNFAIFPGKISAKNIVKKSGNAYQIEFEENFINKTLNELMIGTLCDRSGNCIENISVEFFPVWAEPGDIVIAEIMADPVPVVSLPAEEYLEIKNTSDYALDLKNWKLTTTDQSISFPERRIAPHENMIICSIYDTASFVGYGKITGLKSFPTLTDGGKVIALKDTTGSLISGVEYTSDWYDDELKAEGGWSLEMIDTEYPFYQSGNWKASSSRRGGTPGSDNSVSRNNPDDLFHGILNVFPDDSLNIRVRFSETVFNLPEQPGAIMVDDMTITDLHPVDLLQCEFSFKPEKPLKHREVYSLTVPDDLRDFAGNRIEIGRFYFGIPEPAMKGDVMFNELLFNPLPGDPDYIELYNGSGKVIDVSRLLLVSVNDATGDTSGFVQVSAQKRCLLPGSYYVVTTDKERVTGTYLSSDSENIYESGSLPSMADDKGHLLLLNRELDLIDEVFYLEKMHYSLLSNNEGIALEKIRPEASSIEKTSWHSASESSGWGTPGAPNSVFSEVVVTDDNVRFSSTKISPDNDGFEDFLMIDMSLTGKGNVVSAEVFDETGSFVRRLTSNLLSGPELTVVWDGTAGDGSLVKTGIYIIFISGFNDTGKTFQWKKVCAVVRD
ncbi:MAG TPA: lamin tail domain-containing protein [Bacteroidales bacterium]|nr:lamin tail domain-containing protein [Bacteroidales bacterium]